MVLRLNERYIGQPPHPLGVPQYSALAHSLSEEQCAAGALISFSSFLLPHLGQVGMSFSERMSSSKS